MPAVNSSKGSWELTHCEVQLIPLSQGSKSVQAAALVVILEELEEAWSQRWCQNYEFQHNQEVWDAPIWGSDQDEDEWNGQVKRVLTYFDILRKQETGF